MLRLLALPFALVLLLASVALLGAGAARLAQDPSEEEEAEGSLLDADLFSSGDGRGGDTGEDATVAGVSLIGFGILGAIAAVVLTVAAFARSRDEPRQQQQQQVIVVTDPDARVETR